MNSTAPDPYKITVKIKRGDGRGEPHNPDPWIICQISVETKALLQKWEEELSALDPLMTQGRLLDYLVALVEKRIGTKITPATVKREKP